MCTSDGNMYCQFVKLINRRDDSADENVYYMFNTKRTYDKHNSPGFLKDANA